MPALLTAMATAQANELVIHLYVDPIYGDDGAVNSFFNPDGSGPECTGAGHPILGPHSVRETTAGSSNHPLLHAPFPFKTITAALNRLAQLAPGQQPLPHTDPVTNLTWSHCIIHLLPGWYGRSDANSDPFPPASGFTPPVNFSLSPASLTNFANRLVPNGETFPLRLPSRVSLAGTSALNTVIDTGQVGTAIVFGQQANGYVSDGRDSFIDKVTFYACGGRLPTPPPLGVPPYEGQSLECAAILIDDQVASRPTISNCMFLRNAIGVLVNAGPNVNVHPGEPFGSAHLRLQHDGTTIINCTFAWNFVGLWNGQMNEPSGSVGHSRLNLVNNIFDGSDLADVAGLFPCTTAGYGLVTRSWPAFPLVGTGVGPTGILSAFEGVSQEDLRVATAPGPVPVFRDFNAYERGVAFGLGTILDNYNQSAVRALPRIAADLPITVPRTPAAFAPGVNIAPFTGWPNQVAAQPTPRGGLYVTDLFCRGAATQPPVFPTPAQGFDMSGHDLRLSPIAIAAGFLPGAPPAIPNPLVDAGFSGPFPATMENGQVILGPPGTFLFLNAPSRAEWQHHCWEADCEGYGNPRIHDHPNYANTGVGSPGDVGIDIGADELGSLLVAGYRFGTTGFLRLNSHIDDPAASPLNPKDNSTLFYLGFPNAALPVVLPQPDYRAINDNGLIDNAWLVNYPPAYAAGAQRTWSSAEGVMSATGASLSRPYFGIRLQVSSPNRKQPSVSLPMAPAPTTQAPLFFLQIAATEIGQCYRATAADVTPALLPDIHPWWTEYLPSLAGTDFATMCPTLSIWQDEAVCVANNYLWQWSGIAVFNREIYQVPITQDLSPPGSRRGDISGKYVWLDDVGFVHGVPPSVAPFENWTPLANRLVIADHDAWCRGGIGLNRLVALPSTDVFANGTLVESAAMRFTIEWDRDVLPPGQQKNLQSFQVLIR